MSLHLVSTGAGSSYNIDVLTYVSPFTTGAGGQMRFTDNSFGVDWAYYSKIQGADANALQQLFRIAANKTISTFNNTLDTPTGTAQFLGAVTMSSLTASSLVYSNASKALVSATLTNGQLLIGSTGAVPVVASITGTASQVVVTPGAGTITLSLPQNIATTSTPTFSSVSLATTGGTATALSYYEEYTHATTYSGPIPTTASQNIIFTRVGRMVTVYLPLIGTGNSTSGVLEMNTAVPARFCPPSEIYFWSALTIANGVNSQGYLLVRQVGSTQKFYWGQGLTTVGGVFPANTGSTGVVSNHSFSYVV